MKYTPVVMPAPSIKAAKRAGARQNGGLWPWIAFPWVAVAPLLVACGGGGPGYEEPTASTTEAIYGGVVDNDASQNASVVAIEVGTLGDESFYLCSGTLIAPNVVLTARHCVSALLTNTPVCDQNGNTTNGPHFGADTPVDQIHVFAGPAIYQNETPSAGTATIFHPAGTSQCNDDVALLVLTQKITTVPPGRVRIATPVTAGETTRAVGFGKNDPNTNFYGTRYRKDALPVLAVGSVVSASQTPLGANEFELGGESTCLGDSGGPVLDETTGAVVGVLSRGPIDCTLTTQHVYTALEGFTALFQQAFAAAGGSWIDENAPATSDAGTSSSSSGGSGGGSGGSGGGSTSSSSGGMASSSGGYQGGVNLHSGQGQGCSTGGVGGGESSPSGALAAFAMAVLSILSVRRRVR